MRRLIAAVLILFAIPATATAEPITESTDSRGLHNCGTEVEGTVGRGWCEGTGKFRLLVACEDGKVQRSPWIRITNGRGTIATSCTGADAVGAEIDQA